jgi:N-acetylmuramoyl-L-alanine amidase
MNPVQTRRSPNRAPRVEPIRFIVLHGTWMADDANALDRLCDPRAQVSCHYYIDRQAQVLELVPASDVAWHAGKSAWRDAVNLNATSLGIEIGYPGESTGQPYQEGQYEALIALLRHLLATHKLTPDAVLGHSDIAPHRKDDPGRFFEWSRLEAAAVAAPWKAHPEGNPLGAVRAYGYVGEPPELWAAFQRRYLPDHVSGTLCPLTEAFIRTGLRPKGA